MPPYNLTKTDTQRAIDNRPYSCKEYIGFTTGYCELRQRSQQTYASVGAIINHPPAMVYISIVSINKCFFCCMGRFYFALLVHFPDEYAYTRIVRTVSPGRSFPSTTTMSEPAVWGFSIRSIRLAAASAPIRFVSCLMVVSLGCNSCMSSMPS